MPNYNLLKDKICLITGTSRGIGKAVAKAFCENGAIVYANARDIGCLEEFAAKLNNEYQGNILPIYFDVTDSTAMKKAIMRIKKEQGKLDVLVNNAGMMQDALIGMIPLSLIEETFAVNVFAVVNMLQLALKLMTRQKNGSIINISSIVGVNGNSGQLVYSASKGAVISLTKTAAKELADKNIRVNAIAPGMIDTAMFHSIGEENVKEKLLNIRMNRIGTPEEVANTCLYLASDLSEYVTGQIIGVDGSALV